MSANQRDFTPEERDTHFGRDNDGRVVPSNIEAEQALLGAILINNEALDAVRIPLDAAHFFDPVHRQIFQACVDIRHAGRKANPVTVKTFVSDVMVGDMTMSQYLGRLAVEATSIVNAPDYALAIMEAAARRACLALSEKMERTAFSKDLDIMDEFDALRAKFDEVSRALNGESDIKTLADGARNALDATAAAYRGNGIAGVDYGLRVLFDVIGPFMPGQLIVVGGGTKQGKTSLVEQLIAGCAINGHPVWVYSGEMQVEELAQRALSRLTDIQAWRQARGLVSDREYENLDNARRNAETWQERIFVRDDNMTLRQIERDQKDFSKRHPNGVAVTDKIDLIERDSETRNLSEAEFGPFVTRRLKMFAKKFRLPQIAVAPFKKNTFSIEERKISADTFQQALGRRPRYGDIYGNCEKDANHVIIPFNPVPILNELEPSKSSALHPIWEGVVDNCKDPRTAFDKAEIILALSRHTRWPQRMDVGWDGSRTMFVDPAVDDQAEMFR
ncbi:DnaB-like helicase N-terminal domain-containing protein [Rhizobium sp. 11515TR]|uniref:DnaB-like helicase N-terminal domain-containing protein n=1 Tax=Rhizobium sp. 11515TR TaxID=2028343 RepID=UPI000BA89B93|nr:DnaB-like helicase N-terminal domain-containing protein [Rhizobium sp. 11515TR]ASW06281.1 hypothetical protein CKA34_10560 [Rhizobium sp. 11515TR]